MTPESDPFELYHRRFEHQRRRDEYLRQILAKSRVPQGMIGLLAEKGINLVPARRDELPNAPQLPQMDFEHGLSFDYTSSEIITTYDDGRSLLVEQAEINEPKEPSLHFVTIYGFVVKGNYRKDPETGNLISRLELVPRNLQDAVTAFVKRQGLVGTVCFLQQKLI